MYKVANIALAPGSYIQHCSIANPGRSDIMEEYLKSFP